MVLGCTVKIYHFLVIFHLSCQLRVYVAKKLCHATWMMHAHEVCNIIRLWRLIYTIIGMQAIKQNPFGNELPLSQNSMAKSPKSNKSASSVQIAKIFWQLIEVPFGTW